MRLFFNDSATPIDVSQPHPVHDSERNLSLTCWSCLLLRDHDTALGSAAQREIPLPWERKIEKLKHCLSLLRWTSHVFAMGSCISYFDAVSSHERVKNAELYVASKSLMRRLHFLVLLMCLLRWVATYHHTGLRHFCIIHRTVRRIKSLKAAVFYVVALYVNKPRSPSDSNCRAPQQPACFHLTT